MRFDEAADAVVCSEVRIEVGHVAGPLVHAVAGLKTCQTTLEWTFYSGIQIFIFIGTANFILPNKIKVCHDSFKFFFVIQLKMVLNWKCQKIFEKYD